jgi:hypothetical protein
MPIGGAVVGIAVDRRVDPEATSPCRNGHGLGVEMRWWPVALLACAVAGSVAVGMATAPGQRAGERAVTPAPTTLDPGAVRDHRRSAVASPDPVALTATGVAAVLHTGTPRVTPVDAAGTRPGATGVGATVDAGGAAGVGMAEVGSVTGRDHRSGARRPLDLTAALPGLIFTFGATIAVLGLSPYRCPG